MAGNKDLGAAKEAKKDEFYTQLADIEVELRHYKQHFKGKTVFCNCDDPFESNFFKYFALNFNSLGLKKLIATCYAGSPVVYTQLSFFDDMEITSTAKTDKKPYKVEITEIPDFDRNGAIDLSDVKQLMKSKKNVLTLLKGDGDFRSDECIKLLKEADIVVTNPPFSLFREYVAQLFSYDKRFVILGNKNAITYKEIFPYIKNNKLWLGATPMSREMYFDAPQSFIDAALAQNKNRTVVMVHGRYMARAQAVWFTNLDYDERHEDLILYKHYTPEEYPKFDNFDAIEVSKTAEIPDDYFGIMGVPITFLDKLNPTQFEIVGCSYSYGVPSEWDPNTNMNPIINGKSAYKRLLIRRLQR